MPENVSVERRQLLAIYGADVISSPGTEGSNGAVRMAQKLAAENSTYKMLFQYENPMNPGAHYRTTGPEILRDLPEIDVFVAGLGTGGTLTGTGRYLKENKPGVRVVAVEPPAGEMVPGLRTLPEGYIPPRFAPAGLAGKIPGPQRQSIISLRNA